MVAGRTIGKVGSRFSVYRALLPGESAAKAVTEPYGVRAIEKGREKASADVSSL